MEHHNGHRLYGYHQPIQVEASDSSSKNKDHPGNLMLAEGVIYIKRSGFNPGKVSKTVIVAGGLGIFMMAAFEILTRWMMPGFMGADLSNGVLGFGMIAFLITEFSAAPPEKYLLIKRGMRYHH